MLDSVTLFAQRKNFKITEHINASCILMKNRLASSPQTIPGPLVDLTTQKLWDIRMNQVKRMKKNYLKGFACYPTLSKDSTFALVYTFQRADQDVGHTVFIQDIDVTQNTQARH